MLQQTQVSRVLPRYEHWLERWPTVASLAAASTADVIREWAGLGYNRRAVNLHRAAVTILRDFNGEIPSDPAQLGSLPGIGSYTAAAVACFATGQRTVVLDTNIARVVARSILGQAGPRDVPPAAVEAGSSSLLPVREARAHNLALMDLGALVCTARSPACSACPLRRTCAWVKAGQPPSETLPRPTPRFETTARFARGRIVDALRDAPSLAEGALAATLPPSHRATLNAYLAALERDGIIVRTFGGWSLPGAREG